MKEASVDGFGKYKNHQVKEVLDNIGLAKIDGMNPFPEQCRPAKLYARI